MPPMSFELIGLAALGGLNILLAVLFVGKLTKIKKRIELVTRSSYYNTKDIRAQTSNLKYYGEQQLKLFEHQRLLLTTMQVQMRKLQSVCEKIDSGRRASDSARKEQLKRIRKATAKEANGNKIDAAVGRSNAASSQQSKTPNETVRKFADLMTDADDTLSKSAEAARKVVKLASIFEQNSEFATAAEEEEFEKVRVNER